MSSFPPAKNKGFTLVEILFVVAIIALLAALAMPNFMRARKRTQAVQILEDLRMLDHAIDNYALDTSKPAGFHPLIGDLTNYMKANTRLYNTNCDLFGDTYGPFTVDSVPIVSNTAFNALSDVTDGSFWSPYH
jgi:prepilin-type N-terminal cleavage/methylation domain-containing protein